MCYLTSFLLRTCFLSHVLSGSGSGRQAGGVGWGGREGRQACPVPLVSFPPFLTALLCLLFPHHQAAKIRASLLTMTIVGISVISHNNHHDITC